MRPLAKRPGGWRLLTAEAGAVRLQAPGAMIEFRALADDLFRLRVTRGSVMPPKRSWAVVKERWSPVQTRFRNHGHRLVLTTCRASLALNRRTGAWHCVDAAGFEVFASPPQGTGFRGGRPGLDLTLAIEERLFGLGETTGSFDKRGLIRELWNIDVLGHASAIHPGLRSLYVSIPLLISMRHGRAAGLFWDNPARQVWDLGCADPDRCQVTADAGDLDLYLFLGPTLVEVLERYTELTGRMPLPPRWALGYHQCRYSYPTRQRVEEVARCFRRRHLPCDALYLDIHHLDRFRVLTFGRNFPKPADLIRRLRLRGFKTVVIVDPGVADQAAFGVLRRGRRLGAFVKQPGGRADYRGRVWPGASRFPDFLNAKVRAWWGREQARLYDLGVAGTWNDMNEPATFDGPGKTLDLQCRHRTDHGDAVHAEVHNVYGLQMARAAREGALACRPAERPFVITRAGYAGIQRYAVVWTGDNSSCWEHLADSVQMLLNLGLSGVAFCGSDVGGFLDDATGELLARWTQMAALTPFFRNHSNLGTRDQEPWAFGREIEAICRRYLRLRYQLMPYLYGLFCQAHRTGAPVMRPLAWHYQNDPVAVATGDQFMLGPSLLVAPILRQGATARAVYLPTGNWFSFWDGQVYRGRQHVLAQADLATLPLFVRAGSILPLAPVREHLAPTESPVVNLHVWPGASGDLVWYEDDGSTRDLTTGRWLVRRIRFRQHRRGGELCWESSAGGYPSQVRRWRVIMRGAHRSFRLSINGLRVEGQYAAEAGLFTFELANREGVISAHWW